MYALECDHSMYSKEDVFGWYSQSQTIAKPGQAVYKTATETKKRMESGKNLEFEKRKFNFNWCLRISCSIKG